MSDKRFDHAKAAHGWSDTASRPELTMEQTSAFAAIAQVHATLALVEQQRIANVISLMQMQAEIDENTEMLAHDALHSLISFERKGTQLSGPVDVPSIRPEIREALGLS